MIWVEFIIWNSPWVENEATQEVESLSELEAEWLEKLGGGASRERNDSESWEVK